MKAITAISVFVQFFKRGGVTEKKLLNSKCIGFLICANILSHLRGIFKALHENKRYPAP